jgi:hypothetical protein
VISRGGNRFSNPVERALAAVPGPGNYTMKMEMNKKGTYSVAKYRNSGAPLFGRAQRETNLDTSVTRKSKYDDERV